MKRKEAIEVIKKNWPDSNFTVLREALETLIPELKESEDEKIRNVLVDYFKKYKEQEECGIKTFFGIPTDNIISWLEKQREQKLAWSEEDEKQARQIERIVHYDGCTQMLQKQIADWLKGLKERVLPQNTWKPSDEQIKAVKEAVCYSSVFSEKTIDNLISLSKDLKKLKEE